MRPGPKLRIALLEQRGHLLLWVPCLFGLGIAIYFALQVEPGARVYGIAAGLLLAGGGLAYRAPEHISPAGSGLAWAAAGFIWAGITAHMLAAPVLEARYYGMIEGRVIKLDQSGSGLPRVTLDQLRLPHMRGGPAPARVTLSLAQDPGKITPGSRIRTTGSLTPPTGPAEPRGFDYQRYLWFKRIGATGYSRKPVMIFTAHGQLSPMVRIDRLRQDLSLSLSRQIEGRAGTVAAAIVTGNRGLIARQTNDDLRSTNLSHLLAISGLHMGLLCGLVFLCSRLLLALISRHGPHRKIAAAVALTAGLGYFFLSGGAVATERAFIMAFVFFTAIFLDRRALTLRAVALAALIVLIRRPEAILSPGFQMSFAATSALIVIAGALSGRIWRRPVVSVLMTSFIAGTATAPYAAAHFNLVSSYGLLANLLSVPVMASLVMPAALAAGMLAPLSLSAPALWVMGAGLDWILWVAESISEWPLAVRGVVAAPVGVLSLITLGALWAIIWQGRARYAGCIAIAAGFGFWSLAERPHLLISEKGGLAGVMTRDGRSLSGAKAEGFTASSWLENDGDRATAAMAASRSGWTMDAGLRETKIAGNTIKLARGKKSITALHDCGGADMVITNQRGQTGRPCHVIGPETLFKSGSIAIHQVGETLKITTARQITGRRLWNDPALRQ